jgi:hypothetical protein
MNWITLIVSVVFTVLISMIRFTGIPGVTGILSTMIPGTILHGILRHGRMHGTGAGAQAGITDHIDTGAGVMVTLITAITALTIMDGAPTMVMVVTTRDITTGITAAGGMPIRIITAMEKEELPEPMFTEVRVAEG